MLAVCLLVTLTVRAEPLPADTIVIATGDWIPYVEVYGERPLKVENAPAERALRELSPMVKVRGPFAEVIRRAYAAAGIQVRFISHPWTRNAQLVQAGTVDAAMPYYCSPKRAENFLCSEPVVQGEQVFFHRSDMRFDWEEMSDLKGYTIGATLGYFYGEPFESREAVGELKVVRVAQDDTNLKLLARGRIDLFPQDRAVGYAMIRKLFPPAEWDSITHHPKPLHRKSLHVIFTRANDRGARFHRIFNRELAEMKASGELKRLLRTIVEADSAEAFSEE